ncbi:GxGYxYP domain-containing protein [Caldithrix abyssi]
MMKVKLKFVWLSLIFINLLLLGMWGCEKDMNQSGSSMKVYHISLKDLDIGEQMLVKSLQGLFNRKIEEGNKELPMIYTFIRTSDYKWYEDYKDNYPLSSELKTIVSLIYDADAYADGYVLWDTARPWTLTIAFTYAAQFNALILTPQLADQLHINKKLLMDFTQDKWYYPTIDSGQVQNISGKAEGYAWALEHLLPGCDMTRLVYLRDDIPDLKDFIIFKKLFAINLDPLNNTDEINLLKQILSKYPPEIQVLGWADASYATQPGQDNVTVEKALVTLLSENNDFLLPADFANNLSFHGLFQPPTKLEQEEQSGIYEKGKKYACFIVSDGDNLQYDFNHMRTVLWEHSKRGKYPLGWTLAPTLVHYAPFIAWYYYNSAAESGFNDTFITGPSGYAYVHPSSLDEANLLAFIDLTAEAMKNMDMSCMVTIDSRGKESTTYQKFAENSDIKGVFMVEPDHAYYPPGRSHVFSTDTHDMGYIVEAVRASKQTANDLTNEIKIAAQKYPFVMVYVHAWDNNFDAVFETIKNLQSSGEFEVVGPYQFMDCLIQYKKQ